MSNQYLHGFDPTEQARLYKQAQFLEHILFQDIDFTFRHKILEIGSGVGAQTDILLRRFPEAHITCCELSPIQIAKAEAFLSQHAYATNRCKILEADATNLPFEDCCEFDAAYICWVLEHVPESIKVLEEAYRVLDNDSVIYASEVLNSSLFIEPYSPNLLQYWMQYNDYQYENGGDPFVGAKLGNLLTEAGFKQVQTEVKTFHLDNRAPRRKAAMLKYWEDLLLSGAPNLLESGFTTQAIIDGMKAELKTVSAQSDSVFYYSFIQARGEK